MPYCKKHDEFYGIYCNGCFNEGRDKPQSPSLSPPLAEEDDDMWHPQDYSGRNAPKSTEERETALRWIKASERLPTDRDKKAARQNGNYMTLRVIEGELVKVGSFTCHSLQILEEWFPGIEWLDESPPLTSETDQPVQEEVGEWLEKQKGAFDYEGDFNHDFRAGAMAMYKREQATIADLHERLAFYEKLVQFDGDLLPAKPIDAQDWIDKAAEKEQKGKDLHYGGYRRVALDIYNRMSERIANNAWEWIQKHTALQSRLSQTEAERDAIKQAFDEQAEELKSVRQKEQEYLKALEFFSRKTGISIPILLDASQKPESPEKKARSKKQQ